MPQVIQFFERQLVNGGIATLYSEVYDVSDYAQLVGELRLFTYTGSLAISVFLQDCMDPALAPDVLWRDVASQNRSSVGGSLFSGSALFRFARVKLTVPATVTAAILSVEAVNHLAT